MKSLLKYFIDFFLLLLPFFSYAQYLDLNNSRAFLYASWQLENTANPQLSSKPLFFPNFEKIKNKIPYTNQNDRLKSSWYFIDNQTNNGSVLVKPVIMSENTYYFTEKSFFSLNGLGVKGFARFKDKLYAQITLFGILGNYPNNLQKTIDTLDVFPHYGKYFKKYRNTFLSGEADFRLTYAPEKYLRFELGKSRHFFGHGKHSLFLSDNSGSMPFVSLVVDVWRLKYRWMVMRAADYDLEPNTHNRGLYSKYLAMHYLSVKLSDRIDMSFFETVVTNPYDQNGKRGLDVNFLNPIIFYRPVEFATGTYDNAIFGLGFDIRLFKKFFLYSQLVIDDLIISELKARSGWWGNKFGIQAGFKAYNFAGLENLFVRSEINAVRPYTYAHNRDNINYGNCGIPLAHPAGANFVDFNFEIKYTHNKMLYGLETQALITGRDTGSVSLGADIYRSYTLRNNDYDIAFLQGKQYRQATLHAYVSYLIKPEIDLSLRTGLRFRYRYAGLEKHKNFMFYLSLSSSLFYNALDRVNNYNF